MHHPMPSNSTAALSLRIAGARLAQRQREQSALLGPFFRCMGQRRQAHPRAIVGGGSGLGLCVGVHSVNVRLRTTPVYRVGSAPYIAR
jgi:hypothetical protein